MKGHFHIKHDPYTGELYFGNLIADGTSIGYLSDALRGGRIGELVAHDVVEHALSHRTKKYVTYESELRAIGALEFIRGSDGIDIYSEMLSQCSYLNRPLKPVPYIIGKFLHDNWIASGIMKYLIQNGVTPADARNAMYHHAWGFHQKEQQFDGCSYKGRCAFGFIERNIKYVLNAINEYSSWGASIYFDTEAHIFRFRMKWGTI